MSTSRSLVALTVAGLLLCCGGTKTTKTTTGSDAQPPGDSKVLVQDTDVPAGLAMRLSNGQEGPDRWVPVTPARARKLGDADARALLDRMPALVAQTQDRQDFALRERSKPAPRTGKTIPGVFPPPETSLPPPPEDKGDLEVVRFSPEGDVPLAPHLSITFSQPMVAITSQEDAARSVPVKLTPTPKGKWRWLGTKTLYFDPDPRFPQATRYTVEIAAGTRSMKGGALKQARSWTFSTPAPRIQESWPQSGPQRRDALMFVSFDQAIDPAAVLPTISVRAGAKTYAVRALSEQEIARNLTIKGLVQGARDREQADRYVAFRVDELLPVDTRIEVTVGPGTPSKEGPLTTTSAQSFSFRTYGPLRVEEARCSWGSNCPPMTPWYIRLSNPLDMEAFDADAIKVSPEILGLHIDASGNYLNVRGQTQGRTTYTLTLPASLTDEFGQTLGKPETLTFRVGSAEPSFWGPSGLLVLDPAARTRTLDVFSTNYKKLAVELYAVTPRDWPAFAEYMGRGYYDSKKKKPPGKRITSTEISIKGETDQMVETPIDLGPALQNGLGHVVVVARPLPWPHSYDPPEVRAWIQSTQIGVDAFADSTELLGWATRLDTGAPLGGVKLEILPSGVSGTTDEQGLGRLELPGKSTQGAHVLVAQKGQDTAILPENLYWWSDYGGWVKTDQGESLRWYVFDDRAMYRPGEEVHLKGWLRRVDEREGGGLLPLQGTAQVTYTVFDPRGNDIYKGKAQVNALGGFDTSFKLPTTPNLGWARVHFIAAGTGVAHAEFGHSFQIQEFRRPEFEVTAQASQGPHMVGGSADITVKASYYAGGGLPGADVTWNVSAAPTSFTPPGRDEFIFGAWQPWWGHHREPGMYPDQGQSYSHSAKTDAMGQHVLHIDFLSVKPQRPMQVTAYATVLDVNRQAWSASAGVLVHPSSLYIGLKNETYFVDQGQPIDIQAIVVDQEGKVVPRTAATVRAVRLDWAFEKGQYVTREEDEQTCERMSEKAPWLCSFKTDEGGQYRITARVVDEQGRANETEITMWVSGGKQPAAREVELEQVTLIPDRKEYRPGDTARILVQAPFFPAEGIMSVRRSGIVTTERFTLEGPSTQLTVPIVEGYIPNVYVQVDIVGSAMRMDDKGQPQDKLPRRPAVATGELNLPVPPWSRVLSVNVEPRDRKLAPAGQTKIDVAVRDAGGRPVPGAEVALVVVDESILSLSGYQLADPVSVFYSQRSEGARDHYMRPLIKLARPDEAVLGDLSNAGPMQQRTRNGHGEAAPADDDEGGAPGAPPPPPPAEPAPADAAATTPVGGVMAKKASYRGGSQAQTPIAVRTNFDALAVFAPAVKTDTQGRAIVDVKVPDNLTRYRVMAVAVAGEKYFGKGESSIIARMPLMVRPSPPRFLNFGDTFELPVVVQNQTEEPMTVRVAVRATNAALTQGLGRELSVAGGDRVEVRFPAAAEMAGTARFQIAAASGKWADAAELALPVWTPATTEAFATYGELDSGALVQPVAVPGDVVKQFGGLEITTSSTQLQALTDAFLYLVAYPYECAEQLSSRILAVAALRDVLTAFEAEGLPPRAEIEAAVKRDMDRLKGMQNYDGGFGFWSQGHPSWPYVSIHVAHALARARAKGFAVPEGMLERSLDYLRKVENYIPTYYPDEVRRTIIAYALSVRKLMGDADVARAKSLIREAGLDKLSLEAVGWLLGVLSGDQSAREDIEKIHRLLDNRVSETAATAHFTTGYSDGAHLLLHSDRRADGIILESLMSDKPNSDLIAKVVRGLLADRKAGRWQNTQENVFILLALDRYFQVFEKVTPNFVARVWLGDAYAGEHRFKGRTTESHQIDIPMSYVADMNQGKGDLVVAKDGQGRLYYRIGMTYAPRSLKLEPADHGFVVERRYEAVDDPGDVTRMSDGTWKIKAGARVRVRLNMVAEARRYHVALVDPMPAGLEAMNPALAVTGPIPQEPQQQSQGYWWWWRTWYEHQNMRDERIEAFASLLWEGVHEYTYVARGTTPGRFVVPPAKAEEMYFPETFGRSGSDVVVIE